MDSEQLNEYRQQLLQLQRTLSEYQENGKAAAQVVELDQTSVGRLSRMDAMQGQAMSQEQGRRRALALQKIAAALLRMERGDYGDCLACEEPIAARRLLLDPAATLCIHCASARESG